MGSTKLFVVASSRRVKGDLTFYFTQLSVCFKVASINCLKNKGCNNHQLSLEPEGEGALGVKEDEAAREQDRLWMPKCPSATQNPLL